MSSAGSRTTANILTNTRRRTPSSRIRAPEKSLFEFAIDWKRSSIPGSNLNHLDMRRNRIKNNRGKTDRRERKFWRAFVGVAVCRPRRMGMQMLIRAPRKYRITWRRVGDADILRHDVTARSPAEAELTSRCDLQLALGSNYHLWEFETVTELTNQTLLERLIELLAWSVRITWPRTGNSAPGGIDRGGVRISPEERHEGTAPDRRS